MHKTQKPDSPYILCENTRVVSTCSAATRLTMDRKPRLSIKTSASKTTLLDRTLSCATTPTDSTDSDQFDTVGSPSSDTASSTRSSTTPNPRHSFEARSAHTTRSPRTNMTAYSKRVSSTQRIPQSNKNALIETGIGIGIRDAEVGGMLEGVQSGCK
jgi:hypothetical protein